VAYSADAISACSLCANVCRNIAANGTCANDDLQGTNDVRLDPQLNKKVWECGIKGVPFRLRVRISRKRNDEEGAKEKLYSYVQAVNVKDPKGLHTQVVEDA
jgi:large subunit ribosomal protein L31e